jgi:peroxiredoxin Q/BCP
MRAGSTEAVHRMQDGRTDFFSGDPDMKFLAILILVGSIMTAANRTQGQGQAPQAPVAPTLKIGDMAPDFELAASDGKTYRLSSFRGKQAVVVAWYPAAFTSGCTIECKSLAASGDKLRTFDITYFMASVDPLEGERGNKAFAEAHKADFPLLSDPTKETAKAYGVLSARGFAMRWTFYIDKQGRIAFIDTGVSARLATSAEDMMAKLEELKVPKR